MSSDKDQILEALKNQAVAGARAKNFKALPDWQWYQDAILGALQDDALQHLRNATSDADRLKAQQMYLAALLPARMLDSLISQGDGALSQIKSLTEESDGQA
jgi:hypothetical protein